ncbi:MAG: hypothetical protein AAFX85_00495 [Pseudomonadota bacterium]
MQGIYLIIALLPQATLAADDENSGFFRSGKTSLVLNHRIEFVDDEGNALDNARASTLRTFGAYETPSRAGVSVRVGVEWVSHLGMEDFNVPGEPSVGNDVVADPAGVEVDEAFVRYTGLPQTELRLGRQYVAFRKAPLHRFVGTVPWRQNWQSMDALRVIHHVSDRFTVDYVYVDNVNRIFGEDNPNAALANSPMSTHLLNAKLEDLRVGSLEGFYYRLDYDNDALPGPFTDRATFGVKLQGSRALANGRQFIYLGELSRQQAIANNATAFDSAYQMRLEAGMKFSPALTAKLGVEILGSDEGLSFATPLATVHAFQGWADRFIGFPGEGVEDRYAMAVAKLPFGIRMLGAVHDFRTATDGTPYGREVDIQLTRKVHKVTLQLKHASYFGDGDPSLGAISEDRTITWFTTRFSL